MNVYKLETDDQKNFLIGKTWDGVSFFAPTLDADGNWVISIEEVNGYNQNDVDWINDLQLITYNPVIN